MLRRRTHRVLFSIYLWLSNLNLNNEMSESRCPCDDLGPIDTLGESWSNGRFTRSYSCEGYSTYSIKLKPLPLMLTVYDGCETVMYVEATKAGWGALFTNRNTNYPSDTAEFYRGIIGRSVKLCKFKYTRQFWQAWKKACEKEGAKALYALLTD